MNGYLIPIGCEDSYIEFLNTVVAETALWIWNELESPVSCILNYSLVEPGLYTLEEWTKENNQFGWYPNPDDSEETEDV